MSSLQNLGGPGQEADAWPEQMGWASPVYAGEYDVSSFQNPDQSGQEGDGQHEQSEDDSDESEYESDESDDSDDSGSDSGSDSSGMDTPDDSDEDEDDELDQDEDEDEEIDEYANDNGDDATQVVDDDDDDYNNLEQNVPNHNASPTQYYPHTTTTEAQLTEKAYQAFLNNPLARTNASAALQNGGPSQQRSVTIMGVSHDYRAIPTLMRSPAYTQKQKYAMLLQCPRSVLDRLYEEWVAAYGHLLSVPLPMPVRGQPVEVVQQVLQCDPVSVMEGRGRQGRGQPQVQQPQIQQAQGQHPQVQQLQAQQFQVQPQIQQAQHQQLQPSMLQALPDYLQQPTFETAEQLDYNLPGLNAATYMPLDPDMHEMPYDPTAPKPVYPAYRGYFRNSAEARMYRRRTKFAPGNKSQAQDVERVRRYGRDYWVRRMYTCMIDVSQVNDGENSVHRTRITREITFDPMDLEATAHKAFDKALESHVRGYTRPMIYHKKVVRGKLRDRSQLSVEARLTTLCHCFATQKATVDDAVRGGVTLALLCDNPDARCSTKYSNNIGNGKRGGRLLYAKEAEEKEKVRAEKKAAREAKRAEKEAEKAAKKAEREAVKQQKEAAKQQREQLKEMKKQQRAAKARK